MGDGTKPRTRAPVFGIAALATLIVAVGLLYRVRGEVFQSMGIVFYGSVLGLLAAVISFVRREKYWGAAFVTIMVTGPILVYVVVALITGQLQIR